MARSKLNFTGAGVTVTDDAANDRVNVVIPGTLVFSVKDYGAKGNARTVFDGAMTAASGTLTSATAAFVAADVGKAVYVSGAGATATTTATSALTSNILTAVGSIASLLIGNLITGTGIPSGTYITGLAPGLIQMSQNATAANTGFTVTASGMLVSTVSAFTNATTVTLAANATTTTSAAQVVFGSDDSAARDSAITAALAAGSGNMVYYPPGNYLHSTSATCNSGTSFVNVAGAGRGVSTITRTAGVNMFSWSNTRGADYNLTANVATGALVLDMASTAGLKADDYILLRHTLATGSTSNGNYGEMSQIQTVNSSTRVTLYAPTFDAYLTANTARISPVPMMLGPQLNDISITSIGPLTTNEALGYVQMRQTAGALISNCTFDKADQYSVQFENSVHWMVLNPLLRDTYYVGSTYLGYGVLARGASQWGAVVGAVCRNSQIFNNGGTLEGLPRMMYIQAQASEGDPGVGTGKAAISTHSDGEYFTFDVDVHGWNDVAMFIKGNKHVIKCRLSNVTGLGVWLIGDSATIYPQNCTVIVESCRNVYKAPDNSNDGSAVHVNGTGHTIVVRDARDLDGHGVRVNASVAGQAVGGHVIEAHRIENWGRQDTAKAAVSLASNVQTILNTHVVRAHGIGAASSQVVKFDGGTTHTGCVIGEVTGRGVSALYGANEAWALKKTVVEAANGPQGLATLVAGTVTVSNTSVTANSRIRVTRQTSGGTLGHLSVTKTAGTSLTITSSSATDTSTVLWELIN